MRESHVVPMYRCTHPDKEHNHGVGTVKRGPCCEHAPMPKLYSLGNDKQNLIPPREKDPNQ